MIKEFFKMPGFKMTWDPVPAIIFISSTGDMAYLIANNEMSMTDSTGKIKTIRNKTFQVWKKDTGNHWKAAASVMYPE
jgi:ketosteroid isomerase-like protein